tara:strand:+ start:2322 stop:2459 length:138 start_codon:yes stop_codon:yes gene_type:complete
MGKLKVTNHVEDKKAKREPNTLHADQPLRDVKIREKGKRGVKLNK